MNRGGLLTKTKLSWDEYHYVILPYSREAYKFKIFIRVPTRSWYHLFLIKREAWVQIPYSGSHKDSVKIEHGYRENPTHSRVSYFEGEYHNDGCFRGIPLRK